MLIRHYLNIGLDSRFPFGFIAGRNAECQEVLKCRVDCRCNCDDLLPDLFRIERGSQVIRELLADRIPIGFEDRLGSFVIKPDRARVYPNQFRDRDMLLWLCQDYSSF